MDPSGPPYASHIAALGGKPTVDVDIPICAVFMFLYVVSAVSHQVIFQRNRRRGHKFIPSLALFGFSMARILTCILRITWACFPSDVSLSIAAQIFVNAGILVVYIINLIFAQRILRARRAELAWHRAFGAFFRVLYGLVGVLLVLVIVFTVLTSYTLDANLQQASRDVLLTAQTILLVISALPLLLLALLAIIPARGLQQEDFGQGSMMGKALIVIIGTVFCVLETGFKLGVNFQHPRPVSQPAWYDSKACFYVFIFSLEILVLFFYLGARVDQRFWVPDGSSKRKSYRLESSTSEPTMPTRDSAESDDVEKGSVLSSQ